MSAGYFFDYYRQKVRGKKEDTSKRVWALLHTFLLVFVEELYVAQFTNRSRLIVHLLPVVWIETFVVPSLSQKPKKKIIVG